MMQLLLETQQSATHHGVRQGRYLIQRVLSSLIVDQSSCRKLLLAYSEIANNIVFHSSPKAAYIGIRFIADESHWLITLEDDGGVWEDAEVLCKQDVVLGSEMQWNESGRGLGIMSSLLDGFEYIAGKDGEENNVATLKVERLYDAQSKPKIMLVWKDKVRSDQLLEVLSESYHTEYFSSVEMAQAQMEEVAPDLIIADTTMNGMNGYDLREYLLTSPHYDLIPFIYITPDIEQLPLDAHYIGIDDYLPLNASAQEQLRRVDRVIQTSRLLRRKFGSRINIQINNGLSDSTFTHSGHAVASAMRTTEIGGGDYIFYQEKKGRSLILLVDIMGHDEAAKFFIYAHAGFFRGIVQSLNEIDLPQLLALISNASYYDQLLNQTTMTLVAACLYEDGSIGLASAGHPPPLLVSPTECQYLPVSGIMPGLMENVEYQEYHLQLKEDERLALYTDGLLEFRTDTQTRKGLINKLQQQLIDTQCFSVHQSVEKVMNWFDLQVGSPPPDDTTLVLIDRQDIA